MNDTNNLKGEDDTMVSMNEFRKSYEISKEIDHPSYYRNENSRECIEEMRILFGDCVVADFCKLNAYKYKYRAGNKEGNSKEKDLAKANWYLDYVQKLKNIKDGE